MADALAVLLGGAGGWLFMFVLGGRDGWGGLLRWLSRRKVARGMAMREQGRG